MAKIRKRTWENNSGKHSCWEITYVIDGKQYRKSGYATELDAQIDLPNVVLETDSNVRLSSLIEEYMSRHCAIVCKPSTQDLYRNYIKVHFGEIKHKIAKDLKKRDIENLILELKRKGLSNKTINSITTFLISTLNYAVESGYLKTNPVPKIKKLPLVKPKMNYLNEKQLEVFLKTAKETDARFYPFFATAVFTGMRRGELIGLEWSDVDFKRAKISVNKQYYKGVKQSTKTNRERVIDIPQNLIEILKDHKQNTKVLSKLVFPNLSGQPIHAYYMEEMHFHPLIKRCNDVLDADNQIIKLRFHDLRHTYATYLLSHSVPVKYVQEQLGHATAKMTLDVYTSVMPSAKFGALDLLGKLQNRSEIEHELSTEN